MNGSMPGNGDFMAVPPRARMLSLPRQYRIAARLSLSRRSLRLVPPLDQPPPLPARHVRIHLLASRRPAHRDPPRLRRTAEPDQQTPFARGQIAAATVDEQHLLAALR